jgi:anaerobic selenocysteine-containing dehydrogenase
MCGVRVTLDDQDRILKIRGDKSHPLSRGYSCVKGVCNGELHNSPERLLQPMKRGPDGSFAPIPLEQALDEIAVKVHDLVAEEGPDTVSAFVGTWGYNNVALAPVVRSWLETLGSRSKYTAFTVDQSAKAVTIGRMGRWGAGRHAFADANVWMIFGSNPLVSVAVTSGVPACHPLKQLQEAKARGMRIVVVDPRRTETARFADIHLQSYPGEDPAVAAGLLNVILSRGLYDADFCAQHVKDLDALHAAVAPFTPEVVAVRAGVPAESLIAAAELWAGPGKRGCAHASTGPCMSSFSNLANHMVETLNVVCGRFQRAGEPVDNGLSPAPKTAEAFSPRRWWERGARSRAREFGTLPGILGMEFPCGIWADEALTPGKGRIRAFFVLGGNPALSFPDQRKVVRAMRGLDLMVAIDPFMSATARLAHYVIPPLMQYERPDSYWLSDQMDILHVPYMQFTTAIAKPPAGAEVIDDWYLFWALGQRLGLDLSIAGVPLDMKVPPTTKDLIEILARPRQIPFEELWAEPRGRFFDRPRKVDPAPGAGRFVTMALDVAEELTHFASRGQHLQGFESNGQVFTHLLASRRMRDAMNSMHHEAPTLRKRNRYNPAYIHPRDIAALGLHDGDRVEIVSDHGRIEAILEADESLRSGVIQMSHAWGSLPDDGADYESVGANVSLLINNVRDFQSINAMARQSGIPVNIIAARNRDEQLSPAAVY